MQLAGSVSALDRTDERDSSSDAAAIAPGRRTRSERLPVQRRALAGDPAAGAPRSDAWAAAQALGASLAPTRSRLLELPGFYRPIARVRDGAVVMFEAALPELADDLPTLLASLGPPDEVADFVYRDVAMAGGEHVFAGRGVTLFVNPENQRVLHLALYRPTTLATYREQLRLDLSTTPPLAASPSARGSTPVLEPGPPAGPRRERQRA